MKKILLSVVAIMLFGSLSAQNVARECVLFEVFTGVRCSYCPAAANAINQMMEEGLAIAPVAVHTSAFSSPDLYTDETNARASFYGISSYPTLKVDGVTGMSGGGSASENMYNYYINYYNNRINVASPFTIDLSYSYIEGSTCQVTAVVNQVGECNANNLKVMIALTESHVQKSWQGMSELNAVTRDFIPTQTGVSFNGPATTVVENFDMAGYPKENMHLVAWIQTFSGNKEVFQAVRLSLEPQQTSYDVAVRGISSVVTKNCSGMVDPILKIKSFGTEPITSLEIECTDENNNVINTYNWTGEAAQGETFEVVMPEFDLHGANTLNINVKKINGNDDAYPFDNFASKSFESVESCIGDIKIQIKTPSNPENVYVLVTNTATGEIVHERHFDQGSHAYKYDISLPTTGCYRFSIVNPEGTGCLNGFGNIKDHNGKTVLEYSSSNNLFSYKCSAESDCSIEGIAENTTENIKVYPNPTSSVINVEGENISEISIYNALGQMVYTATEVVDGLTIEAALFEDGLYLVNIKKINGEEVLQRLIIKK